MVVKQGPRWRYETRGRSVGRMSYQWLNQANGIARPEKAVWRQWDQAKGQAWRVVACAAASVGVGDDRTGSEQLIGVGSPRLLSSLSDITVPRDVHDVGSVASECLTRSMYALRGSWHCRSGRNGAVDAHCGTSCARYGGEEDEKRLGRAASNFLLVGRDGGSVYGTLARDRGSSRRDRATQALIFAHP